MIKELKKTFVISDGTAPIILVIIDKINEAVRNIRLLIDDITNIKQAQTNDLKEIGDLKSRLHCLEMAMAIGPSDKNGNSKQIAAYFESPAFIHQLQMAARTMRITDILAAAAGGSHNKTATAANIEQAEADNRAESLAMDIVRIPSDNGMATYLHNLSNTLRLHNPAVNEILD